MSHPSPFSYRSRQVLTDENVVGHFMVAFQDDPDHEYPFVLYRDGTILPELDPIGLGKVHEMFARYLADPNLHHVSFFRQEPLSPEELDAHAGNYFRRPPESLP